MKLMPNVLEQTETLNPIKPQPPHFSMWIGFLYIILFISLYISFTSFGGILHYAVNQYFKDPIEQSAYSLLNIDKTLLKMYIAGIIVSYPIFAILFIILKKQIFKNPAVKNLTVRKLLIYITLIITFLIMIGHLTMTLYGFLSGKSTIASFMHFLVTFSVAGSIFIYFLLEIFEDRHSQ